MVCYCCACHHDKGDGANNNIETWAGDVGPEHAKWPKHDKKRWRYDVSGENGRRKMRKNRSGNAINPYLKRYCSTMEWTLGTVALNHTHSQQHSTICVINLISNSTNVVLINVLSLFLNNLLEAIQNFISVLCTLWKFIRIGPLINVHINEPFPNSRLSNACINLWLSQFDKFCFDGNTFSRKFNTEHSPR